MLYNEVLRPVAGSGDWDGGGEVYTVPALSECFLPMVLQGRGAGAVGEETSPQGRTAECPHSPGKKRLALRPGAATGTAEGAGQPGSYLFYFSVPGRVVTLGLSFCVPLQTSQPSWGSVGVSMLVSFLCLGPRGQEVASAGLSSNCCMQVGKIRTQSRMVGGLGHIVGVIGKRYFRELVADLSSTCWEGNVKCENEVGQHGAVEGWGRGRAGRERLGSTVGPPVGLL